MELNKEARSLIRKLSANLEKWKKSNNISQRQLAKTAGIAESTIRSIIKDSHNIEIVTLVKLKLAFSIQIKSLFLESTQCPILLSEPLPTLVIQKAVVNEQKSIGKRISSIMK